MFHQDFRKIDSCRFFRKLRLIVFSIWITNPAVYTVVTAQTCVGISNEECRILYTIYDSTNGDNWVDNTNWLSLQEVSSWAGVWVEDGHVVGLGLGRNNITGEIPPEIGGLSKLQGLNMVRNKLTGAIPPELGNLTDLQGLYLCINSLTGPIPPELGNLVNLEWLWLEKNYLSGPIPPELGNLTKLDYLGLHYNNLTGPIPSELGNLTKVTSMPLYSNYLTGPIPPELGNLLTLSELDLSSNFLSGEIPPALGKNNLLRILNLGSNNLTGSIPAELGNTNLQELRLNANQLSGDLPAFLADPPDEIDLSYNGLSPSDPAVLAAMESKHASGFMTTQTVPPENVSAETVAYSGSQENRIKVSWDPISYTGDEGGYQVFYRRSVPPGEEMPYEADDAPDYFYYGMTSDKNETSLIVTDLEPGVEYDFKVDSVTYAHTYNKNDVKSQDSDVALAVPGNLARAFIPAWKQAPGYFTGVVVSNFGDTDFDLSLSAFDEDGVPEALAVNPVNVTVESGRQTSRLGWEFFYGDPYNEDFSWIELAADGSSKMGSIFLYGVSDTQMLDGAESQSAYARKLYFTRPLDEGFFAGLNAEIQMSIVNPTDEEVTVRCALKGSNGEAAKTHTIASRGFISGDTEDLIGAGHGIVNGYLEIEVTAGDGVIGFSRIEFPNVRTALGMNAVRTPSNTILYSAQLAHGADIVTNLQLVNTSQSDRAVTLKAVADDGATMADPVTVEISGNRIFSADLGTLFSLDAETTTTGSLVVEADGNGIIGDIIFAEGETMEYGMSSPLQERLFTEAVFNHISNLPTVFTGFAFFNPGDEAAEITIEAIGLDGQVAAGKVLNLGAGERISRTLTDPDIWPDFGEQSGGYIKIQSTKPIVGQQLFGDRSLRYMAAVPPTTRLEGMFE